MLAELHRPRQPAALGADHLRRLAGLLVRRQLRPETAARRGVRLAAGTYLNVLHLSRSVFTPLETGRAGAGIAGVKQLGEVSPNFVTIINLSCNVARV